MKVKKRGRKQKLHLIFDEEERKDFLLGFHKRKEARKLKAKEELATALKEEKKKLKIEQKEALKNMLLTQRGVPEVEHLLEPTVYDLPDHTITISEIPSLDLPSVSTVGNSSAIEENQPRLDGNSEVGGKDIMKKIKEQRLKAIKSSSTFNVSKTLQKKKDKKEAKKKKRLLQQNVKKTKKNRQKKNKRK